MDKAEANDAWYVEIASRRNSKKQGLRFGPFFTHREAEAYARDVESSINHTYHYVRVVS